MLVKRNAAANSLQSCPTPSNPMDCSPQGSSVMGFSSQEYWSGLPLPSPHKRNETGITPGQGSYERTHKAFYLIL